MPNFGSVWFFQNFAERRTRVYIQSGKFAERRTGPLVHVREGERGTEHFFSQNIGLQKLHTA